MDSYNKFAYLYDELMNDFDYENWYRYIEEIFKRYDRLPKEILEMACGTGNLSYYIGKAGYKLTCFDLSDEMLAIAYKKLSRFKNIRVLNQDMIDFNLNKKFDSIISICDSINYIVHEDDLLKVFKNVWNHLNDDGIFIFDINSHYKIKEIIGNNTFIEDRGDIYYSWQNYYNEDDNICDFYLTFFLSKDGDSFMRFDEEHRERAYNIEEVIELLNRAGFNKVEYFECFTFKEPHKMSERINFVAFK